MALVLLVSTYFLFSQKHSPVFAAVSFRFNPIRIAKVAFDNAVVFMKVLWSGVAVVDGRGKLNGSVASKNRGGAYFRTKVTPVNPQTVFQTEVRNRLGTFSSGWRSLTEAQREAWNEAAATFPVFDIFGNQKILSGQQLYVRLNCNIAIIGEAPITSPPLPVAIPAIGATTVAVDASAHTATISSDLAAVPAGFSMVVAATGNFSPGISFVKNKYRIADTTAAAGAFDTQVIDTEAINQPYTPVAGQKNAFRFWLINNTTGQAGVPVETSSIVVA